MFPLGFVYCTVRPEDPGSADMAGTDSRNVTLKVLVLSCTRNEIESRWVTVKHLWIAVLASRGSVLPASNTSLIMRRTP